VLTLLLVALGLGLSNFAASVGIGVSGVSSRDRLHVAVIFGLFETGMPVLGVLLGHGLASDLGRAARWTGAVLLIVTGCYALLQATRQRRQGASSAPAPPAGHAPWRLVVTGAALSVDNLAVGFALGATHAGLAVAALGIGTVSVGLSLAGLELGRRVGAVTGEYAELASGLVLVGVGIAIAAGVL
jgi:manganese efflux pump family protein